MKHLLSICELSVEEMSRLFIVAHRIKNRRSNELSGKTLGIIMEKPSTRTTVSFAVAMYQLGGLPIILTSSDLQRKRGETVADTAKTLSRYLDAVALRSFSHDDAVAMAANSTIPVINALTDKEHPCQVLGDVLTILEKTKANFNAKSSKDLFKGIKHLNIAFVGDSNNVLNSWLYIAAVLGLKFRHASPVGFGVEDSVLKKAISIAKITKAEINLLHSPQEAVKDADVVYTDVWTSMGKEAEEAKRLRAFRPFQLNEKLLALAKPGCMVMHCLPARRGEEITDGVIDGKNSIVFDQAENRLHIQKAILLKLISGK